MLIWSNWPSPLIVTHGRRRSSSSSVVSYSAVCKDIIIGGASAASEATLSSSPLRFAVYVGIIIIVRATKSLRR